jgi:hypothetical protein
VGPSELHNTSLKALLKKKQINEKEQGKEQGMDEKDKEKRRNRNNVTEVTN